MMSDTVKVKKMSDGRLALAIQGRLWTTTIRRMAEIKAEQLRELGYGAIPGDKYPYVVYIAKIPEK
jgi:hypothetical protein